MMEVRHKLWLFLACIIAILAATIALWPREAEVQGLPAQVDFNYHIRPILSQNCFVCHGPDSSTRKAELRLDNYDDATALRPGGAAIVPGKPGKSPLIDRVMSTDPEFHMPPREMKKRLNEREIGLLKKWIKQGAKWKPHWAFIPPVMPELPDSLLNQPAPLIIDALINRQLHRRELAPSPRAPQNSLVRRISYLLTGLPPTIVELETFGQASEPFQNMVDYYLASPRFGERWARHWMDLVRYGEAMGHEFDYPISGAWRYRDYLIKAFNQDVPYDQLVREHLAGDLLTQPRYDDHGYNQSVLGTAFFFLGEGKHSPVSVKQEEADRIDNMIDVTSKTFQALTVGCARCHDHKFDPIPASDYYSMYGMLASSRITPLPARQTRENEGDLVRLKQIKAQIRQVLAGDPVFRQATNQPARKMARLTGLHDAGASAPPPLSFPDIEVIGDFRQGHWDGWYSDGWAFGPHPSRGEPILNSSGSIIGLEAPMASSRTYGPGVMGALRSPNFIIDQDSIVVRARGSKGTIRIISENFQVIRYPLYGTLEKTVTTPDWKTYTFDLSLVQGTKAYIEFLPGTYQLHNYKLGPKDYIDVQYAILFSGEQPEFPAPEITVANFSEEEKTQALMDWSSGRASLDQLAFLNQVFEKQIRPNPEVPELIKEFDRLSKELQDSAHVIGLTDGDAVFSPVFLRGSINKLDDTPVPHRFLSAIQAGPSAYSQEGSGRLAWAESIVDPENPLTARVMVNRIWHHLFGRGIVETVDNFGIQGKLPTHPALLDYLALRFIDSGWSIKMLIRDILLTQAFQRSTQSVSANVQIDPQNLYLHYFPIRRLEAEAIRDGILAVSSRLDLMMYGPPVPVHLTPFMSGRGRPPESGPLDGAGRRSIYTAVRRNFLPPFMLVFDMPIPFSTFGRRNTTNVPAQSLALLNDPFVHDQASFWAQTLLQKGGSTMEQRITAIYLKALSRPPSAEELANAFEFLENSSRDLRDQPTDLLNQQQLWADYCHTIINLKEFIYLL